MKKPVLDYAFDPLGYFFYYEQYDIIFLFFTKRKSMINVGTAQELLRMVTLFFAYCMIIPLAGYTQALVAKLFGDDTPEQFGFLTLNPLAHIWSFDILFLYLMNFGFGRYIPVNPTNIGYRYKTLKLALIYFSKAVVCFVVAVAANILLRMNFLQSGTSFVEVIVTILAQLMVLSSLLFRVKLIVGGFWFMSDLMLEKKPELRVYFDGPLTRLLIFILYLVVVEILLFLIVR